jgi:hypothetical protein
MKDKKQKTKIEKLDKNLVSKLMQRNLKGGVSLGCPPISQR